MTVVLVRDHRIPEDQQSVFDALEGGIFRVATADQVDLAACPHIYPLLRQPDALRERGRKLLNLQEIAFNFLGAD